MCRVHEHIGDDCLPLKYTQHSNCNKFNILMSTNNEDIIKAVAEYLCRLSVYASNCCLIDSPFKRLKKYTRKNIKRC